MRNYLRQIKEKELLNGSNDFVYNFYYQKSQSNENWKLDADLDEETEHKLLSKNDSFLDIVLAQYCIFPDTLAALFIKSMHNNDFALRLACISNKTITKTGWGLREIPYVFFKGRQEDLKEWLKNITENELDALFRNGTISDKFLIEFIEDKNISEEHKTCALGSLYYSERISKNYDGPMDGMAEYKYSLLFKSIWDLARTLPVEKDWAAVLSPLLAKVNQVSEPDFNISEVINKWSVADQDHNEEDKNGFLNNFEFVRYEIYKNTVCDSYNKHYNKYYEKNNTNKINTEHFNHPDKAYRACCYTHLYMDEEDIETAYTKDKLLAINYMIDNYYIWHNKVARRKLRDICWNADDNLHYANSYQYRKKHMETKYPDWFIEEIETDDSNQEILSDDDQALSVGAAKNLLQESHETIIHDLYPVIAQIVINGKRQRWVFYGVLLLVILSLFKLKL